MRHYKLCNLCSIHILWNIKMFWPVKFHWNDDLRFTLKIPPEKVVKFVWRMLKINQIKILRNKTKTYEVDPLIKDFVCNIFGWWWSCQNRIWYFSKGWQWFWWPFSQFQKSVTNISILLPIQTVSNIRHQANCLSRPSKK